MQLNLDAICEDPGPEGTFWRLLRVWNPNGVDSWLQHEHARGTSVETMAQAMGGMAALVAWSFAQTTGSPSVAPQFLAALKKYESRRGNGLIIPASANAN